MRQRPKRTQPNDIAQYRAKQQSKRSFRKMFLAVALLLLLAAFGSLFYMISQSSSASGGPDTSYPVSLVHESPLQLHAAADRLVVTTSYGTNWYDADAQKTTAYAHGLTSPVTVTKGDTVLCYEQGGNKFYVEDKKEQRKVETDQSILFCEMNAYGMIAVVTDDPHYTNCITIYDARLEEKYKYYVHEHVLGMDFHKKNQGILVTQSVVEGELCCVVYGVDFAKQEEIFRTSLVGTVPLSIRSKGNGDLTLLLQDRMIVLDEEGQILEEFLFPHDLVLFEDRMQDATLLAIKHVEDTRKTDLYLLDDAGQMLSTVTLDEQILDLYCDDGGVLVLTDRHLYQMNFELTPTKEWENNENYRQTVRCHQQVYALSYEQLQKMK